MENIEKIDVRKMKADIKVKVEEQKFYKQQRKFYLFGKVERKISEREAQWKHQANRQTLRQIYAAYAIARGKDISLIDKHPEQIEEIARKIVDKYKIEVQAEIQE